MASGRNRQLKPTSRVGPYDIYNTLGEGNYGQVKFGINRLNKCEYAIKIVERNKAEGKLQGTMDIRREMSLLRCLDHPHIIQLYDVMISKRRIYLVMECANKGDLFKYVLKHGRLSEAEARKYFQQLIEAINYCHKKGVYHRDLKPENLLLSDQGDLKVTDFGFGAMIDRTSRLMQTNCGSPHYCAPEVWGTVKDTGYDGSKSDAFSAGVILYVLLCGSQPFFDENEQALLRKVNQCSVTYPKFLSDGAKDVLSKLIVKNPLQRWSLNKIRSHEWFNGL